jgi:hypothetical protein
VSRPRAPHAGGPRPTLLGTSLLAAALALSLAALTLVVAAPPAAADGPRETGERPIDELPFATLAIEYFTDCNGAGVTSSCGGAPAHWFVADVPVQMCTHQFLRPATLTAEQFRTFVEDAAEMWNQTEAAVGIHYLGDCTSGFRWEDNDVNEIGFDDTRNIVTSPAAAITRGSWFDIPSFGTPIDRRFVEADVIIEPALNIPEVCIRSIIAHELGHVLGFGHSDVATDLMYNSFNPDDLASCPTVATDGEVDSLQELYGVNLAPTFAPLSPVVAIPGSAISVSAPALDPENDPITYLWEQIAGSQVTVTSSGASASFTVPNQAGESLRFNVTARDNYHHPATAEVVVTFDASTIPPTGIPSFAAFRPGSGSFAGSAALAWSSHGEGIATYEFCTSTPFSPAPPSCSMLAASSAPMSWDTIVGAAGSPTDRRVFTTGARETSLAACNAAGCSAPGVGPLVGGLRWTAWDLDFDYLAMAFDVPSANLKFTIGGVVNIDGPARRFELWVGTADDPLQERIHSCGNVAEGAVCIGLLTPADGGHLDYLTIVSTRNGTPTTEHRIRIR